ncbi:MAG TPA: biotin transporter BioY [Oceanithermus profundus]|uniref:Biotin transporter n=1 Tax=Oceanithermus profundus TaxID=187137 RepID=A0A7C4VCG0_9DEIN|nr:biotin transporter BioY [Oceanithermus profundus]
MNATALVPSVFDLSTTSRRVLAVALGAAFVAALAQVALPLPFTPVPVTLQTLGVLLVGAALGRSLGAQALGLYLAAGAAGLPVFAGGGAGPGWLAGPTGGYLLGFVAAAWLLGALVERFAADRRPPAAFLAMLAASAAIYAFGLAGLAAWLALGGKAVSLGGLLALGFWPFALGDLLKAALAAALLPAAWKLAVGTRRM